jgi:hypothetical protein
VNDSAISPCQRHGTRKLSGIDEPLNGAFRCRFGFHIESIK